MDDTDIVTSIHFTHVLFTFKESIDKKKLYNFKKYSTRILKMTMRKLISHAQRQHMI